MPESPINAATPTLEFFQSAQAPQLYAASDNGQPPAPGTVTRWFLLPQAGSAGQSLTLAQTWATAGTYLFLAQPLPVGGDTALAKAAWQLFSVPSFTTPRVAWLASGVPVGGQLQAYVLSTVPGGSVTSRALYLPYRNYALVASVGTAFGLNQSVPAFTLTQTSSLAIALTTDSGATQLAGTGSVTIPLQGPYAGSWQFPLAVGMTNGVSDLTHLDLGMRTYYPTPDSDGSDGETLVTSLGYPLLDPAATPILEATFAPWSDAEEQTFFAFAQATAALNSCYRNVIGDVLTLTPVQDASGPSATPARLVLALRPSGFPASDDDLYTLVPKGDFLLTPPAQVQSNGPVTAVAATPGVTRFMCGLSGVEYVGLAQQSALSFFTGAAAYADGFDPNSVAQAATQLTTAATTAWGLPSGIASGTVSPLTYFAQPDGAVLFQPTQSAGFAPLVYLEVSANTLPATATALNAVPLFPYAGVASDDPNLDAYRAFEAKVASPNRRATVAALGTTPPSATLNSAFAPTAGVGASGFASATPQGLLAIFADTSLQTIDELVLAQMEDGSRFSLYGIPNGDPLRTAISSNQLFLVLSNPKAIAPYLSSDATQREITIEGWNFALDADEWIPAGTPAALDTAMIFKFAQGRTVDLINDTGSWAKAQSGGGPAPVPFNVSDSATSARLAAQIQAAIAAYNGGKGDTDFATFVTAVTDPTWQGIIFLNVTTPLTQLPQQCEGLAAGIDPSLFRAHHVAIETAKIDTTTTPLSVKPSSMFGLINYVAPQIPIAPTGAPYQFQVDSLKVLFINSAISTFSSKIELMIRQLFGDTVALTPAESVLILYGALQRQTIAGVVYDTYLFRTAQNAPADYPIVAGNVFNEIRIGSAQFITELNNTGDGLTHTQFALTGFLDFAELELDVFSFGRESSGTPAGLQYSKLLIRMVFNPAVQSSSVFTFDASTTAFDTSTSYARSNSLYNHFPVTLAGITQADAVTTPGGSGYLGLQSSLTQSALVYPWFGLVFNLDLGTLGALAAKAGFVAQLIAAWSPSAGSYKVFVGLKLPGSDGGKGTISVEGVLNISFRALVLGRIDDSKYFLLLNAIALKLLSISFPPGGQIDMALFGNPVDEHNSSLGWYAAYTKDQSSKKSGAKDRAARAALRQTAVRALAGGQERRL